MTALERGAMWALRQIDPEQAHGWALWGLSRGLAPVHRLGPVTSDRLKTGIAGLDLPNPIGIAAGFDKNAVAVDATLATGPGFTEIGAVTPRPQPGNPQPRLFRLSEDQAAINRFGFNNLGQDAILTNLRRHRRNGIVGVNLGANKDSEDKAADYISVLQAFAGQVAFATVNVSSPNTERLRDLQGRDALDALLSRIMDARDALPTRLPVFLKIAPDLSDAEIADIAVTACERRLDAIIATNTTVAREALQSPYAVEAGGLSGAPLFERSTAVLRRLYRETGGSIPLIGAGGVATAKDALAKIRAGATVVQLYTALIYGGIGLIRRMAEDLDSALAEQGIVNVQDVVGAEAA